VAEAFDAALAVVPVEEAKDFLRWCDGIARNGEAVRLMKEMLYSPDPRFRLPALFRVLDLAVGTPAPQSARPTKGPEKVELVFTVGGIIQTREASERPSLAPSAEEPATAAENVVPFKPDREPDAS
jgi:hypothetical protein